MDDDRDGSSMLKSRLIVTVIDELAVQMLEKIKGVSYEREI